MISACPNKTSNATSSERHSMQWITPSYLLERTSRSFHLKGKMSDLGENGKRIMLVDYLQKDQAINGDCYSYVLRQLRKSIKIKRVRKLKKGVCFTRTMISMAAVRDCDFEIVDHHPYSRNLMPTI